MEESGKVSSSSSIQTDCICEQVQPRAEKESNSDDSSDSDDNGVNIRPATMAAKKCESSSEDSSSEEEESGNPLPPWWPTSSVETEAGRKFWLMPELMDRLLLMLDARSMLSLAEVQPLAVRILRGGSQPWRKLIKGALDNPVFEQDRKSG